MDIKSDFIGWKLGKGSLMASDIRIPIGNWPTVLNVESHKTGALMKFYITSVHKDRDGDIQYASYSSRTSSEITLTVFND